MLLRTHLAITVFFVLLFLPHISNPAVFIITALVATLLPDIDSAHTSIGSNPLARLLTFFSKHRGVFHSLTFCIIIALVFAIWLPIPAFGFFLGYSMHILADSFTKEGVMPFWPVRRVSSWHFNTGGMTETIAFIALILVDLVTAVIIFTSYS